MRRPVLALVVVLSAVAGGGLASAGSDVEHTQDRVLTAWLGDVPAADGGVLRIGLAAEDAQFSGGGAEKHLDVSVEHVGGSTGHWRAASPELPRSAFSYTPNLGRAVLRSVELSCVAGCTGTVDVSATWTGNGPDLDLGRTQVVANDGRCDHWVVARLFSQRTASGSLTVDGDTARTPKGELRLASRVEATDKSC